MTKSMFSPQMNGGPSRDWSKIIKLAIGAAHPVKKRVVDRDTSGRKFTPVVRSFARELSACDHKLNKMKLQTIEKLMGGWVGLNIHSIWMTLNFMLMERDRYNNKPTSRVYIVS